ncbi:MULTISPECIES: serine hydrolase domain-containing protein [Streptomyces]|uniref:Beta-lactamase family protein n=1 Tax=Streptomyces thermoviolaceus subsp. thermoviolaceus TaxID=66860 RepID=A0ABX0YSJ6_STRTL|nr:MULTISPECIES: serine hydrolase domain-containing protein [Streptomyces]MCM3264690.1 beta-lactamase family protein [Streptomyces thermoviolaceus]NJP15551.1 beta-lactamase family protein [Streptomyces thermoviolaceus subsp. thermoviolaceus]RSS05081.1 class A beta-lactamase-related serine hydrolase [Streptomyces sp. WAC00469]WTD48835.1 beta-lactamase family protein [Streptomyces thermoviolaceus]GGV68913.1 esterase [Streptomyces thermoviolaceus subsp. apingens]
MDVNGAVAEGFEPVRQAFAANFTDRGERGAAVAVYRDGHKVVDLWAGTRDVDAADDAAPWEQGTAQIVRSATKGVAAAVLLLLHQRGELDLDAPVGSYWPEYKAAGKEHTRVWHLLAHRAGVPVLDRPLTAAEAVDPERGAAAVAAQAPVWEPGTDHGYHAQTYSWLTGELVRRVTGRSIGAWIAQEIAGPVGADLWVGLPAGEAHRAGRVGPVEAPAAQPGGLRIRPKRSLAEAYGDPASLTRRAFGAISPGPDENDPAYRAAVLPASNGIATADGLARFYASLIGEVDGGVRLFTPETAARARAEVSAGPDRVLVASTRFGLGYMLHGGAAPLLGPGSFGHPGRGGALGFADPDSGIAFGYVTNGFRSGVTADPRAQALVRAVRASLA